MLLEDELLLLEILKEELELEEDTLVLLDELDELDDANSPWNAPIDHVTASASRSYPFACPVSGIAMFTPVGVVPRSVPAS